MRLASPAYPGHGTMPVRFAATGVDGGRNVSVPLSWDDPPAGSRSFVLALIDIHPVAHHWVHWLVIGIPGDARGLSEGASHSAAIPVGALELTGTGNRRGYSGPQPPAGSGVHDYVATLYALDIRHAAVDADATWEEVRTAMSGHVLGSAELVGRFGR
jgi:Raf kinase inhibitor-like YbhB/YbcL family protein